MLDGYINYIVSGLERSGTSLMMQILDEAGFPILYDTVRKADEHNPQGYYELYGGLILREVIKGTINFNDLKGACIKITSIGLMYLPKGNYKILYMDRNINEIVESQRKMGAINILADDYEMLDKVDRYLRRISNERDDFDILYVNYRNLIVNPDSELKKVSKFLDFDISKGKNVIDSSLYRNRIE